MTKLRKFATTTLAVAMLGTASYFIPITAASAGGYYSPGNGYYGKPYYYQPPGYVYRPPHCHWVRYRYHGPYGGWLWGRRWVCD